MPAVDNRLLEVARAVRLEDVAANRGLKMRRQGNYELVGACPRCGTGDDRFSINVKEQVWNCRRCKTKEFTGDVIGFVEWHDAVDFRSAVAKLTGEFAWPKKNGSDAENTRGEEFARFPYPDENGALLFEVVRYHFKRADGSVVTDERGKPRKKILQRRPDPENRGEWIWDVKGVRSVPYRLDELVRNLRDDPDDPVYIPEGEPKVDLLINWDLIATCNPGGAGKFTAGHAEFLRGRDVIIVPDNDAPGRRHCDDVGALLQNLAKSVRVLELPGLPQKGDIIDWKIAGGKRDKFCRLAAEAPAWITTIESAAAQPLIIAKPFTWRDPATIPSRQFLYGRHYIRKAVGATIGAPGRGKTTLAITDAVSMGCGRDLLRGQAIDPLRVWVLNGEEDQDELDRRVAATCQRYGITEEQCGDRLFVQSVRDRPLRLATLDKGAPMLNRAALAAIETEMAEKRIDVLMIDPLVSFHSVSENYNEHMDLLVKEGLGGIASRTDAAVDVLHHPGKPRLGQAEATVDDARGASAIIAAVRSARVLNFMTTEEASRLGIAEDARRLHIRTVNGKANMGPLGKADWFQLRVEDLANGDQIACASPWMPPNPFQGVTAADMHKCRALAQSGAFRADSRSSDWVGYMVADALSIPVRHGADNHPKDLARIKEILRTWFKNNVFAVDKRLDENRKERKFVIPGSWSDAEAEASDDEV